jgi:hypothetical protein
MLCWWLLLTPALVLQLHIDPWCSRHMHAMPTSSRRLFSAWMDFLHHLFADSQLAHVILSPLWFLYWSMKDPASHTNFSMIQITCSNNPTIFVYRIPPNKTLFGWKSSTAIPQFSILCTDGISPVCIMWLDNLHLWSSWSSWAEIRGWRFSHIYHKTTLHSSF